MRESLKIAVRFDAVPVDQIGDMKINQIMHIHLQPRYVGFSKAKTALRRVDDLTHFSDDYAPKLKEIWAKVKEEYLP